MANTGYTYDLRDYSSEEDYDYIDQSSPYSSHNPNNSTKPRSNSASNQSQSYYPSFSPPQLVCPICEKYSVSDSKLLQAHASNCGMEDAMDNLDLTDFTLKCPHNDFTGNPYQFFLHYTTAHYSRNIPHGFSCPVCTDVYGAKYSVNQKTNLLQHLQNHHSDLAHNPNPSYPLLFSTQNSLKNAPILPTPPQPLSSSIPPPPPLPMNSLPEKPSKRTQWTRQNEPKNMKRSHDEWEPFDISQLEDVPITPKLTKEYLVTKITPTSVGEECAICFEEFVLHEEIARLQCLCFYHKQCIDDWWSKSKDVSCPTHRDIEFQE